MIENGTITDQQNEVIAEQQIMLFEQQQQINGSLNMVQQFTSRADKQDAQASQEIRSFTKFDGNGIDLFEFTSK